MTITPRPYQVEARDAILGEWESGKRCVLLPMATGLGKTVIAAMLLPYLPVNGRAMILTPRVNIMRQFLRSCAPHCKVIYEHGPYRARFSDRVFSSDGTAVLSTFATVYSRAIRKRAPWLDPMQYDFLIIDECHHMRAKTWERACRHFLDGNPKIKALAMTATPKRGDNKSMGALCDSVVCEYYAEPFTDIHGVKHAGAIADGWLVPLDGVVVRSAELQLSDLRGRDFSNRELDHRMHKPETLLKIAETCCLKCDDLKTLVFVPGIHTAEAVCGLINGETIELNGKTTNIANARPGSACCITNKTHAGKRLAYEQEFRNYRQGDPDSGFQFLVNVNVYAEGADFPDAQALVNAILTKLWENWVQRIGRILRVWPINGSTVIEGLTTAEERRAAIAASPKPFARLIDLTGDSGRHGLSITSIDYLAPDIEPEVRDRALQYMEQREYHAREAIKAATEDVRRERVEARTRAAQQTATVRLNCTPIHDIHQTDIVYRNFHTQKRPTRAMIDYLETLGVHRARELTIKSAHKLLDKLNGIVTPTKEQAQWLRTNDIDPKMLNTKRQEAIRNWAATQRKAGIVPTPEETRAALHNIFGRGYRWVLGQKGLRHLDSLTPGELRAILRRINRDKMTPIAARNAVMEKEAENAKAEVLF